MATSLSRFVAGTFKLDRVSDLNAPLNDTISQMNAPNKATIRPGEAVCDFSNADSQYERYKNLMQSNFYSLNANTTAFNPDLARPQNMQNIRPR
jgi:multidrug resistance efflux pump